MHDTITVGNETFAWDDAKNVRVNIDLRQEIPLNNDYGAGKLIFININVRNRTNKTVDLEHLVEYNPDIVIITET